MSKSMTDFSSKHRTSLGISNFDHSIDNGLMEELMTSDVVAQYSGWNFCGYVWFDKAINKFVCQVWQYHTPMEEVVADSLKEIMSIVSDKYGEE